MNKKQLLILLVVVVVLGIAGLLDYRRNQASWQSGGQEAAAPKLLGNLPINDVAAIVIKGGTNELDLIRKHDLWRIQQRDDYPANFSQISSFLLKAADLKAVQTEEVGPSLLGRYKLLPPGPGTNTAVLVELRDQNGKPIKSMLLGKTHMRKPAEGSSPTGEMDDSEGWPDGRYVMVGTQSKTVDVVSDPLSDVQTKPDQWLNKDFFKVEKIRSIAVNFPVASNSWKVTRPTETSSDWKLADATPDEKLDSSKTSGFSYALSSPSFNDVLPATDAPAKTGLDKPTVLTLDTFDNFTYTINVGQKINDDLPVMVSVAARIPTERTPGKDEKPADKAKLDKQFKENQTKLQDKLTKEQSYEKWVYLVPNWTLDSLLKDRSQLLVAKKEEPKKAAKPAPTTSANN